MPKHVPTFKHLLTTYPPNSESASNSNKYRDQSVKGVNDLISRSRANRPVSRDSPPHLNGSSSLRVWTPQHGTGASDLVNFEDGGIHPAELLRRSNLTQRAASRSTAGPAPPRSWVISSSQRSSTGTISSPRKSSELPISTATIRNASSLFSHPLLKRQDPLNQRERLSKMGPLRLVEHCLQVVLMYLEDETVLDLGLENEKDTFHDQGSSPTVAQPVLIQSHSLSSSGSGTGPRSESTYTFGALLRQQTAYLEPHLRSALLDQNSLLPEGSQWRMSDRSMKSLLGYQLRPEQQDVFDGIPTVPESEIEIATQTETNRDVESWDDPTSSTYEISTIPHLPLTVHSSPHRFLRDVPCLPLIALTSLNLSFSTLPIDLEKFVAVLPSGLRELSLAGVRMSQPKRFGGPLLSSSPSSSSSQRVGIEDDWVRGFEVMGRKLIVLRFLDLSYPAFELSNKTLTSLLHPPTNHLPSLRLLGMRKNDPTRRTDSSSPPSSNMDDHYVISETGAVIGTDPHDYDDTIHSHVNRVLHHPDPEMGSNSTLSSSTRLGPQTMTASTSAKVTRLGGDDGGCRSPSAFGVSSPRHIRDEGRKRFTDVIRGQGRTRWVEVVWD